MDEESHQDMTLAFLNLSSVRAGKVHKTLQKQVCTKSVQLSVICVQKKQCLISKSLSDKRRVENIVYRVKKKLMMCIQSRIPNSWAKTCHYRREPAKVQGLYILLYKIIGKIQYLLIICACSSTKFPSPIIIGPASAIILAFGWTTVRVPIVISPK